MKTAKRYPFLSLLQQRFQLNFDNQSSLTALPDTTHIRRWIWQAVKSHYRRADISLILLDENEAREYNLNYRNKDYATNVLSFPHSGEYPFSDPHTLYGDLIICPQVLQREAAEQGKTLEAHFAHLIIHGTLHLMGYDHIDNDQAAEMEALETQLLAQFNYPNPYEQDEY